ncbi:MAG: peptidylprolyl isomerase [Burkholderiales bacterium]|nr:peptidylprolyl isomerase [Burkholderiales bacterium]
MRAALAAAAALCVALAGAAPPKTPAELLAQSPASDWRLLDPESTLYMELASGRVVIELAPHFAPQHAQNIRTLARAGYFDGLAIVRVQDNYVTQWGDPDEKSPRAFGKAKKTLAPEFTREAKGLEFVVLPDPDTYAPQTGFSAGFAAARDPKAGRAWLVHCYGVVGAGRDNSVDSGNGAELYAIIGNAPRLLDRNITVVGRVVQGMELLSPLRRGTGAMGFYEKAEERTPIREVKLASELPADKRMPLEALRTESRTFRALVEMRRFRQDDWYKVPAGHVDVCNVPLPVRLKKP